jgi:hypothetical protein
MEKAMMDAAKKAKRSEKDSDKKTTINKKDRNPFRMMGSSGNVMEVIQKAVLEEPKIEGLFTAMPGGPRGHGGSIDFMKPMLERIAKFPKPVFFYSVMETEGALEMLRLYGEYNIPLFSRTEDAAKNFAILVQETKNKEKFSKAF